MCGRYEGLTRSCFGGTGLARLELALIALVDGREGPAVAQVAGPNDESGVGLDQFEAVGAAWTSHCKDGGEDGWTNDGNWAGTTVDMCEWELREREKDGVSECVCE